MELRELAGRHIDVAAFCPVMDTIFLIDRERSVCALQADTLLSGDVTARLLSVQGASAMKDAKIINVIRKPAQFEKVNGEPFGWSETHFVTTSGTCIIITALLNGNGKYGPELIALPFKGYPPDEAVALKDFARTALPEKSDAMVAHMSAMRNAIQ